MTKHGDFYDPKKGKNTQPQRRQNQQQNARNQPNAPNQAGEPQPSSSASSANTPSSSSTPPVVPAPNVDANGLTPEEQEKENKALAIWFLAYFCGFGLYTPSDQTLDAHFYRGYKLLLYVSAGTCFFHNYAIITILCILCTIHHTIAEIFLRWWYTR